MSIRILDNKNLLTKIILYSDFDSTMSFKLSKRKIGRNLDVKENEKMNKICLFHLMSEFRNEEDEDDFDIKMSDILYKSNDEINNFDWEQKRKKLKEHKEIMTSLLEPKINESLDFIFKYHIFLPSLRKNNVHLEFANSSIVMLKLYDYNKLQKIQECYYDKYITIEYMNDVTGTKRIIPLREKQHYEKDLLNLRESIQEVKGNERYLRILVEQIMEYDYKKIKNEFKGMSKEQMKEINPIFFFNWMITVYFKLYLNNVNVSILRKKKKKEKYLQEFIKQHKEAMNTILFIDNMFNNVNIIINYWYKFLSLENPEKEKKFSLFDFLLKMYKDKVYNKIIENILEQMKEFLEENQNKEEDKMIIEDDDDLNSTNDSSFSEDEKDCKSESDPVKKVIEEIGNCILDIELNPMKACAINHSGIKLGEIYQKYEKVLKDIMEEKLNDLKEEDALKTFEEMKTVLETDKNPRCLISKNYKIINRTKKKLTVFLTSFIDKYTKDKFNITNKNYTFNSQNENYDDFSEESEEEIKEKIRNDINDIKKDLIEKEMEKSGLKNGQVPKDLEIMVNNYVDKCGDDMITLAKESIIFKFREEQFFQENDKKIRKMLKGNKDDPNIYEEKK